MYKKSMIKYMSEDLPPPPPPGIPMLRRQTAMYGTVTDDFANESQRNTNKLIQEQDMFASSLVQEIGKVGLEEFVITIHKNRDLLLKIGKLKNFMATLSRSQLLGLIENKTINKNTSILLQKEDIIHALLSTYEKHKKNLELGIPIHVKAGLTGGSKKKSKKSKKIKKIKKTKKSKKSKKVKKVKKTKKTKKVKKKYIFSQKMI